MSHPFRTLLLAGAAGLSALAGGGAPARAADATQAEAASIEAQLRVAIGNLIGPSVKLPERPVRVTADGDHYDMAVPFSIERIFGLKPPPNTAKPATPAQITGMARPGDNGTWIVDNVSTTSPLTFTVIAPLPPADDDKDKSPKTAPVTYTVEQQGQTGRIVWDPSFKTASTWTGSSQGTTFHARGRAMNQDSSIGPISSVTTLRPADADRSDVLLEGDMQDYNIDGSKSAVPMRIAMKHLRVTSALDNVDREKGMELIQSASALLASNVSKDSPALKPLVKAMLAPLQDLASDFSLDEIVDGVAVQMQGQDVTMDHLRLGLDARSDAGLMRAGMTIGIQGLGLPDFPLGPFADLLPQKIEFRPVVGGVTSQDLLHMANLATDDVDPSEADIAALFSHGGVTGGIDSMTIEIGGATFTGHATVIATAPNAESTSGSGQMVAENYDALMQKVTAVPTLAQYGLAALVFLRGIGHNVDNKLVWDFTYKDGKVLVNDVDMTAMAGLGARSPDARPIAPTPNRPTPGGALKQPGRPTSPGQIPSWGK